MNFIILGDKFQKRMKSKGCVGLIKINNKNILQYQHKIIKQVFPEANIIYVYGFEGKRFYSFINKNDILSSDITGIYNPQFDQYNHSYSLFLAQEFLNDNCMILFGDTIISKKTFDKFKTTNGSQIFLNRKQKNKLGCVINNERIEHISYDLDNYLSEIYYLTKDHANTLKQLLDNKIYHNYFIFEMINKLIDLDQKILPFFSEHSSLSLMHTGHKL
jgi:hypothetical protein